MGLPQAEVLQRLESGDISFILEQDLPENTREAIAILEPFNRMHPQAAFFTGLLIEATGTVNSLAKSRLLYALALDSSSAIIQREAGRKLILPVLEGEEEFAREVLRLSGNRSIEDAVLSSLRAASFYRLGNFNEAMRVSESNIQHSSWNMALYLLSSINLKDHFPEFQENALTFFLSFPVDPAWQWALMELGDPDIFSPEEQAAILGRGAVSRFAFNQGLNSFRSIYSENEDLFFEYPELTRDLGRAFISSPAGRREGIELFNAWESKLDIHPLENKLSLQYFLPYYIGRLERQLGQLERSNDAFIRAHLFAPDSVQEDACIWYILMNAIQGQDESTLDIFKIYIPKMNSFTYFRSILDQLSLNLVRGRDWQSIQEIFSALNAEESGGGAAAPFAWILGRAIEENYLDSDLRSEDYFEFIFNERNASIYYRAISAWKLGLTLIPEVEVPSRPVRNSQINPEMDFLEGFFKFSAAAHANPFIRDYEDQLSLPELRSLAASLSQAERIADSLNLINRYMNRPDLRISEAGSSYFPLSREDLILFYPRPFQESIEKYALEEGIAAELLFAIIRTESFFQHEVTSHAGAVGLGQLMPATAMDMAGRMARQGRPDYRINGEIDLRNPEINIHIGSFYIDYLFELMGTPMTAILAYNGGLGRVRRWRALEEMLPEDIFLETIEFEETREYGRRVLSSAAIYGYLYYGMSIEEVVADIYR